jgi:hypothetical protein
MMMLSIVLHAAQMYLAEVIIVDSFIDPMRSLSTPLGGLYSFPFLVVIAVVVDNHKIEAVLINRLTCISLPFVVLLLLRGVIMGALQTLSAN